MRLVAVLTRNWKKCMQQFGWQTVPSWWPLPFQLACSASGFSGWLFHKYPCQFFIRDTVAFLYTCVCLWHRPSSGAEFYSHDGFCTSQHSWCPGAKTTRLHLARCVKAAFPVPLVTMQEWTSTRRWLTPGQQTEILIRASTETQPSSTFRVEHEGESDWNITYKLSYKMST